MIRARSFELSAETARRLLNMLRTWERTPRNVVKQGAGPRRPGRAGVKARTGAGGIAAATSGGTSPGSATVTLYKWNGSALVIGAETVTAYNFVPAAVGANKVVTLGPLAYGIFEVIVEPC